MAADAASPFCRALAAKLSVLPGLASVSCLEPCRAPARLGTLPWLMGSFFHNSLSSMLWRTWMDNTCPATTACNAYAPATCQPNQAHCFNAGTLLSKLLLQRAGQSLLPQHPSNWYCQASSDNRRKAPFSLCRPQDQLQQT